MSIGLLNYDSMAEIEIVYYGLELGYFIALYQGWYLRFEKLSKWKK